MPFHNLAKGHAVSVLDELRQQVEILWNVRVRRLLGSRRHRQILFLDQGVILTEQLPETLYAQTKDERIRRFFQMAQDG